MLDHVLTSKEQKVLEDFIGKYGGLNFDKVKFRPGAPFTTGFGFDNTFKSLRFHTAIDRGSYGGRIREVYAPFDISKIIINEAGFEVWGNQLRLIAEPGFEVRIAHISISDEIWEAARKETPVKAGTFLGFANTAGTSTGIHTHVEVVCKGSFNTILKEILRLKNPGVNIEMPYLKTDYIRYLEENKIEDDDNAYSRELRKKRIGTINDFMCLRKDYIDGEDSTFYSSRALFGM